MDLPYGIEKAGANAIHLHHTIDSASYSISAVSKIMSAEASPGFKEFCEIKYHVDYLERIIRDLRDTFEHFVSDKFGVAPGKCSHCRKDIEKDQDYIILEGHDVHKDCVRWRTKSFTEDYAQKKQGALASSVSDTSQ